MFKRRRGGGGGRRTVKRPITPSAPPRLSTAPAGARSAPIGAAAGKPTGRGFGAGAGGVAQPAPGKEESFGLVTGEVDFGAIIRLTPDLVAEMRSLESQGGVAKIKFDANSTANVIDVGGKVFRFTWSREPGHLCDIYEEQQSREDGHGLLVERGSAWRKLDVNRILDESTKNYVKMRSEEAERQSKSRKVHLLDHSNPSIKNQVKSMAAAAVDGSMRRMNWKPKKEPFPKKRKVETNPGPIAGPPKSAVRIRISSDNSTKSGLTVSPISFPPEQPTPAASALPKGDTYSEGTTPSLNVHKEHIGIGNFEKEMPSTGIFGALGEVTGHKSGIDNQPMDLQSILIRLLAQNPKGMSLKALEKAVGQTIPNNGRKIESVIKNIAKYQAPGRYVLKPGLEVESSKKGASESGSLPHSARYNTSAFESKFGGQEIIEKHKLRDQLSSKVEEALEPFKSIDIVQENPDLFYNGKKFIHDTGGRTSSSQSGSDTESDSSDSGSDSGSQSRSQSKNKSPVGSGSASSSDSETDGSSSSKEGSDDHVDIMISEDEKEETEPKSETADLRLSSSNNLCRISDDDQEQIDIIGRNKGVQVTSSPIDLNSFGRDNQMSIAVTDAKNLPTDKSVRTFEHPETDVDLNMDFDRHQANCMVPEVEMSSPDKRKQLEDHQLLHVKSLTSDRCERVVKKNFKEKGPAQNDKSSREQTEKYRKQKSKKTSVSEYIEEKSDTGPRSKCARSAEVFPGKSKVAAVLRNSNSMSPDKLKQGEYKFNDADTDSKHDGQTGKSSRESKSKISNTLGDSTYRNHNITLMDDDTEGRKSLESLSDGDDSFYTKYDKEEPDLRGPINDHKQYEEYVQEYHEKYKCYISLNNNLETMRVIFRKAGEDAELSKGRDIEERYRSIGHLKELYDQHGPRNKRMKKVFIVLHEELKALKQRIQDFAHTCATRR